MHRKHDVQAFSKHRQKHRRAMFLSEHRLNIPSLRNGKHPNVKKCENPPALVGHAVRDDIEGQHSRDLGWEPTCWACNLQFATTASLPATGRSAPTPPTPPRVPPPQVVGCY